MKKHHATWLAGVLDACGCWSVSVAGRDGTLCGTLRLQVAGPEKLTAAILAAAQVGGCRKAKKTTHWSVAKSQELHAIIREILPFSVVRKDFYRRLIDWPIQASGERGNVEKQKLRYEIANELGLLDPLSHSRRANKRSKVILDIYKKQKAKNEKTNRKTTRSTAGTSSAQGLGSAPNRARPGRPGSRPPN